MRVRRLVLLAFFAYVALDLGCPFVPGAFSFDPDGSVDAVSAYRARPQSFPRVAVAPPTMMDVRLVVSSVADAPNAWLVPSRVGWQPHVARDHTLRSDPPLRIEDD